MISSNVGRRGGGWDCRKLYKDSAARAIVVDSDQACVAGVVSAYRDGGEIIRKIKVKRAERRAVPPPKLLEDSVEQAPQDIEREKQRGLDRFGQAFKAGDHIAVIALQQITIQLQGSLLGKLKEAVYNDEVSDFTSLIDAADFGRDRTVETLLQLRQRLLVAAPITEVPSAPQTTVSPPPVPPKDPLSPPQSPPAVSRNAAGDGEAVAGASETESSRGKRKSSLLGFFKHHRRDSNSTSDASGYATPIPEERTPSRPPPSPRTAPLDLALRPHRPSEAGRLSAEPGSYGNVSATSSSNWKYQDLEEDSAAIWRTESDGKSAHRDSSPSIQPMSPSDATSARRIVPQTAVPTPAADNNYLGFCKGACKLQNGEKKAMSKMKEFNDVWTHSEVYYLGCTSSKCAFAGRLPIEEIWTKVWTSSKGIKFRWAFLAKSHVPQTKVHKENYAYQCLFCAFLGEETPVFHGTDTLLKHVQQHRGQPFGEVIRWRTKCINNCIAPDDEEFDINLYPLPAGEYYAPIQDAPNSSLGRKESAVLDDALLAFGAPGDLSKTSLDTHKDSMFAANEPWNEGLSDFRGGFDDEFPRSELE